MTAPPCESVQGVPLLVTKLHVPPLRPNLVPRPRLIEHVNAGLDRRLTLISAPAGFGKTTLLSEWIGAIERPVAWLSLDEGDNDPARFLAYLVGALQEVNEAIGQPSQSFPRSPQMPPAMPAPQTDVQVNEAPVAALINDIVETATPLVLVLDDYHLIHAAPIHQATQFLLEHQPPQMHLVISTREDPLLPLSRLRARGQVVEIRAPALRFTVEETTTLLNSTMGLHLSPQALATLEARTEGWIAGLQLAALSLQESENTDAFIAAFAGDDRHVMDYLIEEVLGHQPREIQDFLLHTAILNRLSAPLCDAVLSDLPTSASSQSVLERLDAANLFVVPLDNRREWYRYHRLFADLLRCRLRREHPGRLADLHRRASTWYEQAGDVEEAIHHAFAIPDVPLAVRLVEQYGARMLNDGRIVTCLNWIRQIPDDVICAHPYLCIGCGWAFVLTGQVELAERYVQAGEAALPAFEPLYVASEGRVITRAEARGDLTAIRAYCARLRGDSAGVLELSQRALEHLADEDYTARSAVALNLGLLHLENCDWDAAQAAFVEALDTALKSEGNVSVAVSALSLQGDVLTFRGELQQAAERYRRAIEMEVEGTGVSAPILAICTAHFGLAEIHLQRDETAAATAHLEKVQELAQQTGSGEMVDDVYYLLRSRLALAADDLLQAQAFLDRTGEPAQSPRGEHHDARLAAARGELCLARGDVEAAARFIAARDLPGEPTARRLPEYLLLARLMLAQGQSDEALALLERLVAAAEASRYAVALIEATILQALAHHLRKNNAQALHHLERALTLAEPQGYVCPFLRIGKPVDNLLRRAITQSVRVEYAQEVLAAFAAQARRGGTSPMPDDAISPLYEPLTERERQVLRLLAAGLSSTEAAGELVIAVSTARSYIKTIYRKLDVHSRDEAINRARQLGLL
jgi:LuxR family maltose regulon positive regulatory protein